MQSCIYIYTLIYGDWWLAFTFFTIFAPCPPPNPTRPETNKQTNKTKQESTVVDCGNGPGLEHVSGVSYPCKVRLLGTVSLSGGHWQVQHKQTLGNPVLTEACFCGILFLGSLLLCSNTFNRKTADHVEEAQPVSTLLSRTPLALPAFQLTAIEEPLSRDQLLLHNCGC